MNPEEGELRPQLSDRFGLAVDVAAPSDASLRCEVVKQRMQYERDPTMFVEAWASAEKELASNIKAAQDRLPDVVLSDELFLLISNICTELKVGSLRADIALAKTSMALAAWEGRFEVEAGHVRRAAGWVLAHRRRTQPFDSSMDGPSTNDLVDKLVNHPPQSDNQAKENGETYCGDYQQLASGSGDDHLSPEDDLSSEGDRNTSQREQSNQDREDGSNDDDGQMQTFTASKPNQIKQIHLTKKQSGHPGTGCRSHPTASQKKNCHIRSLPTDKPVDLALDATLRAAAANGLSENGQPIIRPENLRRKVRGAAAETLILFVVDSSGSMAARRRMEAVKGAALALLTDARQRRDRVGVVACRGPRAEVLLAPTRCAAAAAEGLRRLPTGGRTPLAHALSLAREALARSSPEGGSGPGALLVVLSDGRANVPLPGGTGGDAWEQTRQEATRIAALDVPTLLLDTDAGHVRVGRGKELGELLNADYLPLEEVIADGFVHTVRQAVS